MVYIQFVLFRLLCFISTHHDSVNQSAIYSIECDVGLSGSLDLKSQPDQVEAAFCG